MPTLFPANLSLPRTSAGTPAGPSTCLCYLQCPGCSCLQELGQNSPTFMPIASRSTRVLRKKKDLFGIIVTLTFIQICVLWEQTLEYGLSGTLAFVLKTHGQNVFLLFSIFLLPTEYCCSLFVVSCSDVAPAFLLCSDFVIT